MRSKFLLGVFCGSVLVWKTVMRWLSAWLLVLSWLLLYHQGSQKTPISQFLQGLNLAGALLSHILGKANQPLASDFQKAFKYPRMVLEVVIWAENLVLIFPLMLTSISITATGTALIFSDVSVDCGRCRRIASGSNSVSCAKCNTFFYGTILLLMYVFQARRNYWPFSHLSSFLSMFAGHPLNKRMALTFTADVRLDNMAKEKRWGKCC